MRVEYDDAVVDYEGVLDVAFAAAKPVLGSRQYAPVVFARDAAEAARASSWVARGGARDDGLERRQFGVETTDAFWVAEAYHQEYWQKWRPRGRFDDGIAATPRPGRPRRSLGRDERRSLGRDERAGEAPLADLDGRSRRWRPRYAVLGALVATQYADSKLDFLSPVADTACTALAFAIGLAFVLERVLDGDVARLDAADASPGPGGGGA